MRWGKALAARYAGAACSRYSGNCLKIIALNICMSSLRKYVILRQLGTSTPSIAHCWKDDSTKGSRKMLQGSIREMIGQGGFIERRGKPRLVETVRCGVTEEGIRLRMPNAVVDGAS